MEFIVKSAQETSLYRGHSYATLKQVRAVMIQLQVLHLTREVKRNSHVYLVSGRLYTGVISTFIAAFEVCGFLHHRLLTNRIYESQNTVRIYDIYRLAQIFMPQDKLQTILQHCLTTKFIKIILRTHTTITNTNEYLRVRLKLDSRTSFTSFTSRRNDFHLSNRSTLFEMHDMRLSIVDRLNIKKLRSILHSSSTQTIQAQRLTIGSTVILTGSIQGTENQFPVIFALSFVPIHRNATTIIRNFYCTIFPNIDTNLITKAFTRFVNSICYDFPHAISCTGFVIRTENNARTKTNLIFIL